MFIEKIHIDTFGKLSELDIELDRSVNIIEGENESGKSTIASFIKFILYGVPPKERAQLLSWKTGGAAGSITVNDGVKRYRIERAVVGNREAVQFVDADTNLLIRHALDGTTPGELLLGVDSEMFSATAFVSQLGGVSAGGTKLSEGIENILFSADENVNTQRASAKLDAARAALLHKNEKGGKLFEMDERCAEMEVRLSESLHRHEEILAKEAQLADTQAKLESANIKADEISARVEQYEAVALLDQFERRRGLEECAAELRERIEALEDRDTVQIGEIEKEISTFEVISREAGETAAREAGQTVEEPDPLLDEYISLGGRDALEDEYLVSRTRAKTFTAVGIIALNLGLILAAIGVMPMMMSGQPQIMLVAPGAVLTALALTMFILGSRSRKNADNIELKYDFNSLDEAKRRRDMLKETAMINALAADAARQRLDAEREEIRRKYGCEPDELSAKLDTLKEKLRIADELKTEYDKNATLISQLNEQLRHYNEDELRDKLDSTVDISGIDAEALPEMRRERDFSVKMAESLEKHCNELEKELAGLYPTFEDPTALADNLTALKTERETLRKKHAAYKLAAAKLIEASETLRESVAPRLASDAAGMMAHITSGKYREIGVGADLAMNAVTENGLKPLDVLSAGTQDAAYLSLRMALITLLYRRSLPPMIYDEAFGRQDGKRLENLLRLIHIGEAQSIIFTSNNRESETMRRLGDFNLVRL